MGAAIARARHDPSELTAKARKTFLDRFEGQVRSKKKAARSTKADGLEVRAATAAPPTRAA